MLKTIELAAELCAPEALPSPLGTYGDRTALKSWAPLGKPFGFISLFKNIFCNFQRTEYF